MNESLEPAERLCNVVPTDAIALLAGVSFGNVVRVMWAIDTIKNAAKMPYEEILNAERIPTSLPDSRRFQATPIFVREMLSSGVPNDIARILNTKRRFGL